MLGAMLVGFATCMIFNSLSPTITPCGALQLAIFGKQYLPSSPGLPGEVPEGRRGSFFSFLHLL